MYDEPGMKGREIEFIPDRLIDEPVVFRGLTVWIPVMALLLGLFGQALFGVGAGFAMAIGTLLFVGGYFKKLKRRMPDGLHIVYLKKLAQKKFSFIDFGYIETSQSWDIRRHTPVKKIVTDDNQKD